MTGFDNEQIENMNEAYERGDWRPDDDPDCDRFFDCPFCGYEVDVMFTGQLVCHNCEVVWVDIAEIQQDYVEPPQ